MKRTLLLSLILLIAFSPAYSQIVKEAIVVKKFKRYDVGDTLKLYGIRAYPYTPTLQYATGEYSYADASNLQLINDNYSYWEDTWFRSRGGQIKKHGWQKSERKILTEITNDYVNDLKERDLVFEDAFLYDYLYQLLHRIHPGKVIKPEPVYLSLMVIKSQNPVAFGFETGLIVLSSGKIAEAKTEKALMEVLTKCVAGIVVDHDLVEQKELINPPLVKASFDFEKKAVKKFMEGLEETSFISEEEYTKKISTAISYTAWQEYDGSFWEKSLDLVKRLDKYELCLEKDYLLYSMLLRNISNEKSSNLKALEYIQKAHALGTTNLIDLFKEEGILQMRLDNPGQATASFLKYQKGMEELEKLGYDMSKELEWVRAILHRLKTSPNGMN